MVKKGGFSVSRLYCPPMVFYPILTIVNLYFLNVRFAVAFMNRDRQGLYSLGRFDHAPVPVALLDVVFTNFQQNFFMFYKACKVLNTWKIM